MAESALRECRRNTIQGEIQFQHIDCCFSQQAEGATLHSSEPCAEEADHEGGSKGYLKEL